MMFRSKTATALLSLLVWLPPLLLLLVSPAGADRSFVPTAAPSSAPFAPPTAPAADRCIGGDGTTRGCPGIAEEDNGPTSGGGSSLLVVTTALWWTSTMLGGMMVLHYS